MWVTVSLISLVTLITLNRRSRLAEIRRRWRIGDYCYFDRAEIVYLNPDLPMYICGGRVASIPRLSWLLQVVVTIDYDQRKVFSGDGNTLTTLPITKITLCTKHEMESADCDLRSRVVYLRASSEMVRISKKTPHLSDEESWDGEPAH